MTAQDGRIAELDVIRGVAVLGILVVNAIVFAWPVAIQGEPAHQALIGFPFTGASAWSWWVVEVFFRYKFLALFSMLFGVSVWLVGGDKGDLDRERLLRRRLMWLALFGVIHGLALWYGDILLLYAWSGFLMMSMRSWGAWRLTGVGAATYVVSTLLLLGLAAWGETASGAVGPPGAGPMQVVAAYRSGLAGSYLQNTQVWLVLQAASLIVYVVPTVGLMMLGLGLFKAGVLSGRAPLAVHLGLIALGGAALAVVGVQAAGYLAAGRGELGWTQLLGPVIGLAYASLLVLTVRAGARRFTAVLGAVGRMAFTNYLAQTAIMTSLFYGGRGLGLYGALDRP
ncbi:MAG TPA: DUF418 domain-containing protein, partial [Caulobacteraceae bacterium]